MKKALTRYIAIHFIPILCVLCFKVPWFEKGPDLWDYPVLYFALLLMVLLLFLGPVSFICSCLAATSDAFQTLGLKRMMFISIVLTAIFPMLTVVDMNIGTLIVEDLSSLAQIAFTVALNVTIVSITLLFRHRSYKMMLSKQQ